MNQEMKRPSEAIITFASACWLAIVAIFNINNPEIVAAVGMAIASSSYLLGWLVDKVREPSP